MSGVRRVESALRRQAGFSRWNATVGCRDRIVHKGVRGKSCRGDSPGGDIGEYVPSSGYFYRLIFNNASSKLNLHTNAIM